jgi:hypothetical protein
MNKLYTIESHRIGCFWSKLEQEWAQFAVNMGFNWQYVGDKDNWRDFIWHIDDKSINIEIKPYPVPHKRFSLFVQSAMKRLSTQRFHPDIHDISPYIIFEGEPPMICHDPNSCYFKELLPGNPFRLHIHIGPGCGPCHLMLSHKGTYYWMYPPSEAFYFSNPNIYYEGIDPISYLKNCDIQAKFNCSECHYKLFEEELRKENQYLTSDYCIYCTLYVTYRLYEKIPMEKGSEEKKKNGHKFLEILGINK